MIVAGVMSSAPVLTEAALRRSRPAQWCAGAAGTRPDARRGELGRDRAGAPEHPQFGMKKLLDALGVPREEVLQLPGPAPTVAQGQRARLVSEAMRPARTTERWHRFAAVADRKEMAQAIAGLAILEAPSAEDEAEAVALILREAAERPGRTAALVTPDRQLARRVSVRLECWDLRVDDRAGQPFAKTAVGALLDLAIEAAAKDFEPVALISLLKHPLCRLGLPAAELRRGVRALELAAFRAPYFGQGLEGVAAALERAAGDMRDGRRRHRAVRRLKPDDWKAARKLVKQLERIFAGLEELFATHARTALDVLAKAHVDAAEALAEAGVGEESGGLWQGEAGEAASKFFATLLQAHGLAPEMAAADYPEFYRSLIADETVRTRGAVHPRIAIWGPYKSRLQQPDVVVLGSLNEGTWPRPPTPAPGSTGRCGRRSGCRHRRSASATRPTSSPRCSASIASI